MLSVEIACLQRPLIWICLTLIEIRASHSSLHCSQRKQATDGCAKPDAA
jgi:hypothetical protein